MYTYKSHIRSSKDVIIVKDSYPNELSLIGDTFSKNLLPMNALNCIRATESLRNNRLLMFLKKYENFIDRHGQQMLNTVQDMTSNAKIDCMLNKSLILDSINKFSGYNNS